jgi:hypothetical protein
MGCCYTVDPMAEGGGRAHPSSGPDACMTPGSTYDNMDCPSSCNFSGGLANYISRYGDPILDLAAYGTFESLYDLRDLLLSKSRYGQEILDVYASFRDRAFEIAAENPPLLRDSLYFFTLLAVHGDRMLRVWAGIYPADNAEQAFCDARLIDFGRDLVSRFRESTDSGELDEGLDFLESQLAGVQDRTVGEILELIVPSDDT